AADARVAFSRHADPFGVANPRGNAHLHRLGARHLSLAAALLARARTLLAAAAAAGTASREHHVTAHRPYGAAALADEALARGRARLPGTRAAVTGLAPRDGHRPLCSGKRVVERKGEVLMEIRAALLRGPLIVPRRQHLGEEVAERRAVVDA